MSKPKARRSPGRPNRISRDQIVQAALEMLQADGFENFTMNRIAQKIGASAMALYTYFPGRDALLDAAADAIFTRFEVPIQDEDWRKALLAWFEAMAKLFEEHPIAFKLIKWDEHIAPAWLIVWMPAIRILAAQGLKDERLTIASNWLSNSAMGLILARQRPHDAYLTALLNYSSPGSADRELLDALKSAMSPKSMEASFRFGMRSIVDSLSELIDGTDPEAQK